MDVSKVEYASKDIIKYTLSGVNEAAHLKPESEPSNSSIEESDMVAHNTKYIAHKYQCIYE